MDKKARKQHYSLQTVVCVMVAALCVVVAIPFTVLGGGPLKATIHSRGEHSYYHIKEEQELKVGDYSMWRWLALENCTADVYARRADFLTNTFTDVMIRIRLTYMPLRFIVFGAEVVLTLMSGLLLCCLQLGADGCSKVLVGFLCLITFIGFVVEAAFAAGIGLGATDNTEYQIFVRSQMWLMSSVFLLFALVIYAAATGLILVKRAFADEKQGRKIAVLQSPRSPSSRAMHVQPKYPRAVSPGTKKRGKPTSPRSKESRRREPTFQELFYPETIQTKPSTYDNVNKGESLEAALGQPVETSVQESVSISDR